MRVGNHAGSVFSLFSVLAVGTLGACGGSGSSSGGPKGNIVLTQASSYTAQATLTIPTVETASGADLTVCWDKIMKDLLCHGLDPLMTIDNVSWAKIPNMTPEQVQKKLAVGQLDTDLVVYRDHHVDHTKTPAETCTNLSKLALGTALDPTKDYVESSTTTYMMLVESGIDPAVNVKSMTFIKPTADSTNMTVNLPDGCDPRILTQFSATFGAPVSAPLAGPYVVDWSQIKTDAFGNPVNLAHLDKVEVGFYQDKTAADIMAAFEDIEVSATSLYQVMVPTGDRSVDLTSATDTKDPTKHFAGFDGPAGAWLVAVLSSSSQTPAPVVLSVLQPQERPGRAPPP
jgi:hypothetical protein